MLGIIGAMEEEVVKIKSRMDRITVIAKAGMDFYQGIINKKEIVVVCCGIGKVNAGICTQILVDFFDVSAIVNTGIAGSLQNKINIGDIVLSIDTLQHDVEAGGFGYPPGQIPRMDVLAFPADKKLLELAEQCCSRVNPNIQTFTGTILSGDQFIVDHNKKKWLEETFKGSCVEMEGAAIAQAAYLNKIPFLIIRAISDKADDSANVDYKQFEAEAINHSVNLLIAMVEEY